MQIVKMSLIAICFVSVFHSKAYAFRNQSLSLGAGVYAQNSFHEVAKSETGETGLLGETSYPLTLQYDASVFDTWFIAPQLGYTPVGRSSAGDTATTKMTRFTLSVGSNLMSSDDMAWDWSIGPGIVIYDIKGAGGTVEMNNGTSTATFAVPGGSSSVKKVILNFGTSLAYASIRYGIDIAIENLGSSQKRTQSLFFSVAYQFGGLF